MSNKSILAKSVLDVKATAELKEEINKDLKIEVSHAQSNHILDKYLKEDKNEDS